MRLLPKMHQKNAIQLVAEWFDKQYYWRLVSARTINGREEGIFAWLATNYILNLLDQKEKPLVGVLDIGGASAQIVFPVNDETKTSNYDKVIINLYGQQHTLFSHSFLGLGQNEMGHQYFDLKSCYPQGFELPSGQLAEGNGLLCKSEISILVNAVHKVNKTVKPVLSLNPIEQWYLLGGLTHMLNDKILPISDQQFNLNNLFGFIDNNICQKNWVNLEELYPDHFILFNYCMLTSYMNALIVNGYGISSRKNIHFMTTNKTADWTIGVVLKHTQT
jgi:apyrase